MKTIAIHQPQYLPYLGFFHKLLHCDQYVILDNVQFQKRGVQNRNRIKTQQGSQWLTVPVIHSFGQLINQVKIATEVAWQQKHWNALVTNYTRAPFFDRYGATLRVKLLDCSHNDLCSLNTALTQWAMSELAIHTPVVYASALGVGGHKSELLIEICRAVDADQYLSGPGGKDYMDLALFEAAGIEVIFQDFVAPNYPQTFPDVGFVPNLSIVDTLFNCGPATIELLNCAT